MPNWNRRMTPSFFNRTADAINEAAEASAANLAERRRNQAAIDRANRELEVDAAIARMRAGLMPDISTIATSPNFSVIFDDELEPISTEPNAVPTPISEEEVPFINEVFDIADRPANAWRTSSISDMFYNSTEKQVKDENGMMKTYDGEKLPESECVYVKSCGRWYSKNSNKLFTDPLTEELHLIDHAYVAYESIVLEGKQLKGIEIHVCKFTLESCVRAVSQKYGFDVMVLDVNNISGWDFKENMTNGVLVDGSHVSPEISDIRWYDSYKNKMSAIPSLKHKSGASSQTYLITEGIKYTFGVEIEVNRGNIPVWMASKNFNMSCVRDGSINGGDGGPEYVTGVLVGDNGIKHLQEICNALSKRTTVDKSCGIHLHLGSIDFSNKFLINVYRLAMFVEDEIFATLPKSRRNNTYCRKLKKFDFDPAIGGDIESDIRIEEDYNLLFKHISYKGVGDPSGEFNKKSNHPMGAKCGYNHDTPRYCWLNFVPAMFDTRGNKGYSIEIRNHGATTNFIKIRNWLLLFMAFMAYAERFPHLIVPGITIKDILDAIMPKKSKSLNIYFNSRKELFALDANETTEYVQSKEDSIKNIKELILE